MSFFHLGMKDVAIGKQYVGRFDFIYMGDCEKVVFLYADSFRRTFPQLHRLFEFAIHCIYGSILKIIYEKCIEN